jgi:hypothetical protein
MESDLTLLIVTVIPVVLAKARSPGTLGCLHDSLLAPEQGVS